MILQDPSDNTKKVTFSTENQNTLSNQTFEFPLTDSLNNGGSNNTVVTALATQELKNKTLFVPVLKEESQTGSITLKIDNLSGNRTIRFPDADATLLSTENVNVDDITFGSGIGAATLIGRTRQQQFFYSGF